MDNNNHNNHNKDKGRKLTEYHHRMTVASNKKKELERPSEPRNSFKKRDSRKKDLKEIELPNDSNVIKGNI
jgi:hypothetical protein